MATFSQEKAAFKIQTPLGPDMLVLLSFRGTESLSGLFEFTLQLGALTGKPVPFGQLLGQCATVTLLHQGHEQRVIHGLIASFSATKSDQYLDHYEMVLRPRLWLLSLNKRSRIFQQQSAGQILTTVLAPVSGGNQQLIPAPTSRNYCTQYRETDLDFARRLCSEEGISHYWVHSHNNHQLILTTLTTVAPSLGACEFNAAEGGSQDRQSIQTWKTSQQLVNNQVAVQDSHFQRFNQSLTGAATGPQAVQAGTVTLQVPRSAVPWQENEASPSRYFDGVNPTGVADPSALSDIYDAVQNRAQNLANAAACQAVVAEGSGTCLNLLPGYQFQLHKHPHADGNWLVLEVVHEGSQEGMFWTGEPSKVSYSNRFKAVPASVNQKPWPPLPRPVVGSVETAIVTGPEGQEASLDPFGRLQVRFWWDTAEANGGNTSCWVRVAQFWAGQGYGAFFWPRVGHEVVVAFEHGDPDRPLVVGSVYNSNNLLPYVMPANTYISGFRTKTQGGTAAENCHKFTLSDVPGSEIINIHAESMLITNQEKEQFSVRSKSNISVQ